MIIKTAQISHEPNDGRGVDINKTKAKMCISTLISYYSNFSLLRMTGI